LTVKKITIALISNNTEEFKRFSIPKYLIVLTLIFLISCAAYFGWLIANYQILKSKMPLLARLQHENEAQRIAFTQLADRIKKMTPDGGRSQAHDPNGNGSLKPAGNGQGGEIADMGSPEPDLIQSKYAIGGGEPAEEDKASSPVAPQLVASSDRDKPPSNGGRPVDATSIFTLEPPSSPNEMGTYPYTLQVGSYRTLKRAEKAISIYRKKNLSPYWVKVDLGENGLWFRVFVGHFKDKEKAKTFKQEHKITDGLIKRVAYANLIGIYQAEEQFEDEFLILEKNGYFPYVIKDEQDLFRLFVGAFFTRAGVEKQHASLLEQGIDSKIVKR